MRAYIDCRLKVSATKTVYQFTEHKHLHMKRDEIIFKSFLRVFDVRAVPFLAEKPNYHREEWRTKKKTEHILHESFNGPISVFFPF